MPHLLPTPLPWYLVGPAMGLVIVGMYATVNKHLGVSGGYVQLLDAARGRPIEAWRLWFLGGLLLGGAAVGLLSGSAQISLGYGELGALLPLPALLLVLLVGGLCIGFGARWAGACTSGHGLSGCSTRSPGSMVAIVTFMLSAVAVTWLIHWLSGGAL